MSLNYYSPSEKDKQRFFSKVDKNGPIPEHCPELGPCHVWTVYKIDGYGKMRIGSSTDNSRFLIKAHRLSYIIENGFIEQEELVLHKCDNPSCVNVRHLFVGTNDDNVKDMMSKGRNPKHDHAGNKNPNCKLTGEDVVEIRKLLSSGWTLSDVADVYKVNLNTICRIKTGKAWAA